MSPGKASGIVLRFHDWLQPARASLALVLDAWRRVRPRQVALASLLGAVAWVVASSPFWKRVAAEGRYGDLLEHFFINQGIALCFLLAIVVADRVTEGQTLRRWPYVAAAIVGALSGAALEFGGYSLTAHPMLTNSIWRLGEWLLVGGFGALFYAHRRQSLATTARLRAAELNRIVKSKEMLEARLKVMQARVEPQFLFNTLAQVRKLFQIDPALAERMLEELVSYLRAAMPKMREASSTVAQEIDLVRAYLGIVSLRLGNRLVHTIDVPPESLELRLPPMILLPLVDHAIVHGLERSSSEGTIRIAARVAGDRLRLEISDSGAGFVPESAGDDIANIRERLAALYGDDASLHLHANAGGGTEAVMDVPCKENIAALA